MTRIFDHLTNTPEDKPLSKVAHAMRRSEWWRTVPTYAAPEQVQGEITTNHPGQPGKARG